MIIFIVAWIIIILVLWSSNILYINLPGRSWVWALLAVR